MRTTLRFSARRTAGISLVEVITTITVMGILACASIATYDRFMESSKLSCGRNTVATLNDGVKKYAQLRSANILEVPADAASSEEEQDILMALQWNDPGDPDPGAPYFRTDYSPPSSDDTSDYRAIWNGAFFELRVPGQAGAGLKIMYDGSDFGSPVVFESGYQPLAGY